MRISENFALPYILKPGDAEAGAIGDSVNMGLLHRCAFLIQFGAVTGDAVLTLKSGATAGTQTTAETFRYRFGGASQGAAGADQFTDWLTSSALTLTAATYANKLLVVEIDTRALHDGQPWLTPAFDAAATLLNVAIVGVGEPRFQANDVPTVI